MGEASARGGADQIGIVDPLPAVQKPPQFTTCTGPRLALEMYNKRGGVLGRQVSIVEADDASNVQTAIKVANKLIKEDRVDFLMGTFTATWPSPSAKWPGKRTNYSWPHAPTSWN